MRYVTTNIRLPEDLWKSLKREAADQGKRLSQIIREKVIFSGLKMRKKSRSSNSLCGVWKGTDISENLIQEAKQSLFSGQKKIES